jgi:hypothetical protein
MKIEATPETLRAQVAALTAQLAGRPLDAELDAWLNRDHGVGSETYRALKASCEAGVAAGAQQFADRHAGAAQRGVVASVEQLADEQPLGRAGRDVAQQLGERTLQGLRHLQQHQDRRVADPVLQVREVPLGDIGRHRQGLSRHAAARAERAHALAEGDEERMLGVAFGHGGQGFVGRG